MYIIINIAYGKWVPGNTPDVSRAYALQLIAAGIARPYDGLNPTEAQQVAEHIAATKEVPAPPLPPVVVVDTHNSPQFKRRRPAAPHSKKPK